MYIKEFKFEDGKITIKHTEGFGGIVTRKYSEADCPPGIGKILSDLRVDLAHICELDHKNEMITGRIVIYGFKRSTKDGIDEIQLRAYRALAKTKSLQDYDSPLLIMPHPEGPPPADHEKERVWPQSTYKKIMGLFLKIAEYTRSKQEEAVAQPLLFDSMV